MIYQSMFALWIASFLGSIMECIDRILAMERGSDGVRCRDCAITTNTPAAEPTIMLCAPSMRSIVCHPLLRPFVRGIGAAGPVLPRHLQVSLQGSTLCPVRVIDNQET